MIKRTLETLNRFLQIGPRDLKSTDTPMGSAWEPPGSVGMPDIFHAVWEKKRQPDLGGALNYAWETLQLPQRTFIGAGVAVREPNKFSCFQPQMYQAFPAITLSGLPTQAGELQLAGLTNPDGTLAEVLPSYDWNFPSVPSPYSVDAGAFAQPNTLLNGMPT